MRRRDLLLVFGGTAALRPLGAAAQQSLPVVGCLFIGDPDRSAWWLDAWHKGLAESGFVEGRNLVVEFRWGKGDVTRLPDFAADLVARRVAVIVTTSEPGAAAASKRRRDPDRLQFHFRSRRQRLGEELCAPGRQHHRHSRSG